MKANLEAECNKEHGVRPGGEEEYPQDDREFTLFVSLSDMGRVGGLVSSFLSQQLKTELAGEIVSGDKAWVSYSDDVIKVVSDIYEISYNRQHRLFVFASDSQPQDPGEVHRLCNTLLDYVQSQGKVKRLHSA